MINALIALTIAAATFSITAVVSYAIAAELFSTGSELINVFVN